MNHERPGMGWGSRIAILVGLGAGIAGGLGAFIAGQVTNRPFRLSMPGLLVVLGTMTLSAGLGLLRLRAFPVVLRRPARRVEFRPQSESPIRYWGLLTCCVVLTLFFFVSAIRMFNGWVPQ